MTGIATVPAVQRDRYDRIHELSTHLSPRDRRLDWTEAVGLAIDAYDAGKRGHSRTVIAEHNPSLWAAIHNRGAAMRAFELLCEYPDEFIGAPI